MFERILKTRWGSDERAQLIRESFPDVNEEAICRALLRYKGNFPPYPKDIETDVYTFDIDGVFMTGIRKINGLDREEHLKRIRKYLMEEIA